MSKFEKFTGSSIGYARELIQLKLDELQVELGLTVTLGNIKYSDFSFSTTLSVNIGLNEYYSYQDEGKL